MRVARCCFYPLTSLASFLACHTAMTLPGRVLSSDRKSVTLLSNSRCIYENLAAEEALLRAVVVEPDQQLLFMYANRPCVVVGRNQNHLQEVACRTVQRDGVALARRSSGGGAVYHDEGNVCFSFITHRTAYDPAKSIQLLRLFLSFEYGVHPDRITSTSRHDLFLDGKKITGSAMRVQRDIAFHHCTLLVSSSYERLGMYLHSDGEYVAFSTSSVASVRAPVTTLERSGVLPPESKDSGDVVQDIKVAAANFFVRHASEILSNHAPWEMHPSVFIPQNDVKSLEKESGSIFILNVTDALLEDTPMVDGEGRKPIAGSSRSIREETNRLRSVEWLFSMPKFETRVAISLTELLKWKSDTPNCCYISTDDLVYFMQGHNRLDVSVVVERRRITSITSFWFKDATDMQQESWCTCLLKVILEEHYVDDANIDLSEANTLLASAMQLECRDLLEDMPSPHRSSEDKLTAMRCFLQAVSSVWRYKNVFLSPSC
ncbi:Biotinyl protein ligase (BPL) and lipoyl protein ligase (LPL) [Trypanosoma melophagium]|uniref:Biotinyl protein ligase (BPL) and lipoyl protein ligase (LPL) n=1 Tax=Trypanosoma melophagium TaxID=715481 RepID=UPI00351A995D|nr:Biotinyl protein ligase (BPL) and lipoyl protein ligase (LPL) [Trypanosoma melophagium]